MNADLLLGEAEVDEPRAEKNVNFQKTLFDIGYRGRQQKGWTNKLIWSNRLVAVDPINLPVTRLFVEEVILECLSKHITKVDVLAFEFKMGLFPNIQEEAKKYMPRDVFDKRAVEKNQVVFHGRYPIS